MKSRHSLLVVCIRCLFHLLRTFGSRGQDRPAMGRGADSCSHVVFNPFPVSAEMCFCGVQLAVSGLHCHGGLPGLAEWADARHGAAH